MPSARPGQKKQGISRARALFRKAELAFPAIPRDLAARLEEREPWVFSTRPLPASPYDIERFVEEVHSGVIDDYAVLAHAGHSVNSYALHYYLVRGPLALFLQLAWGGAYGDDVRDRAHVRQCFSMADRLLKATGAVPATPLVGSDRLLVVGSDFYGSEWRAPNGTVERLGPGGDTQHVVDVLAAAIQFVEQGRLQSGVKPTRRRLRNQRASAMIWKPRHQTVVQVASHERQLFARRSPESVLHKYQLPERKGINRHGEFPVAVIRRLYEALGYEVWFSGQAKLGDDTYLLTRMPGKRSASNPAFKRITAEFGEERVRALNEAAATCRQQLIGKAAGGDPDLFVRSRQEPGDRFFVEVKLEDLSKQRVYVSVR